MKSSLEKPGGGALVTVDSDEAEARHDPGTLPDEKEPAEVALNEVLAQLGEDKGGAAKCMVWRIPKDPGDDEEFLYEVNAVDFAKRGGVSDLAKRYGAGIYRIRVYSGGRIYTHKRVKVGAPLVLENSAGADVAVLRAEMVAVKDSLAAALEKLTATQRPQPTLSEQIKDLAALRELSGGAAAPQKGLAAQMKETLELVTLMKGAFGGGEGGGESGFSGALGRVAEKYLPQILETVGKAAPGAPALPNPVPAAVGDRAITEGDADMGALRDMQLKMAMSFLIDSAARGHPAETYADVAVDKVDAADLVSMLDRPDWLTQLSIIDPRAQQHAPWFTKLRAEILGVLRESGVALRTPPEAATLEAGAQPASGG